MRQTSLLIGALLFIVCLETTLCAQQSNEPAKVEVGGHFTSLIGPDIQQLIGLDRTKSDAGIGARFTFNLTKHIALEAEGNFFNRPEFDDFDTDNVMVQGQFGIKAGKRFEKFGIFAKARPGFLSVGDILVQTGTEIIDIADQPTAFPVIDVRRQNFFTMDVGGVLEFYPSPRIIVRFDAGDTIMNIGDARDASFIFPPLTPPVDRITHNFQFSSGIAFRFFNPDPVQNTGAVASGSERKFEVGAQFSSLRLNFFAQSQLPELGFEGAQVQSGFGGRLTYNFNSSIGAEVQTDFYPAELSNFANGRGGGNIWQVQAGPKIGKRFERFGVFGKIRPGAVSFSNALIFDLHQNPFLARFHFERRTYFSLDVGGVLEFYPSPQIVLRFDGGDTIIRYSDTNVPTNSLREPVERIPAESRHQFQFSAGVGFRF